MITLRDALPDEAAHITDSWARSFFRLNEERKYPISPYVWHRIHRAGIAKILAEPDSRVIVACHEAHPAEILGWACWQPAGDRQLYLHYVHVKRPYRRNGIGRTLALTAIAGADERGYVPTHRTWMWHQLSASLHDKEADHAPATN